VADRGYSVLLVPTTKIEGRESKSGVSIAPFDTIAYNKSFPLLVFPNEPDEYTV